MTDEELRLADIIMEQAKRIESLEAYIKNVDAALSYSGHLVAWFKNERRTLREKYRDLAANNFDNMEGCADGTEFAKWEAYYCAFTEIADELSKPILLPGETAWPTTAR